MAETRWLSDEEQRIWRAFLFASRLLFSEFERDMQRGAGMPLTYYEILSVLSGVPNRALRMSELAEALQVSPSRISHAVSRLEEAGCVRREPCPSDRRVFYAVLTDHGYRVLEEAAPAHVESVRTHLFDQLTPEQQAELGEISRAILKHLFALGGVSDESMAAVLR